MNKEWKPMKSEFRIKEIDLIQSVINRMADNQMKVKGFCITILGFFLYMLQREGSPILLVISSLIILCGCYYMDCFYLKMERMYRVWYDFLQYKRSETNEWFFQMKPSSIKIILDENNIVGDDFNLKKIYKSVWRSKSMVFYIALLFVVAISYLPASCAAFSTHFSIFCEITL